MLPLLLSNGSFFLSQTTSNWEIFNSSNSPISNNTIRCLAVDSSNTVWIGTDHGLFAYNQGTWSNYNTLNSGLTDDYIRALAVDQNNHIWVGTTLSGVFKFDGTSWVNFNTSNSGLVDNFIRTIRFSPSHEMWIGTVEGLCRYDWNVWSTWTIANSGLLSNNITSIAFDQAGTPCVTTINGGIFYIVNENPIIYTLSTSNLPDNSSIAVQYDALNKPWFASTAQGLFTETGNQIWLSFNVTNSAIPTNSLTAFEIDKYQNFLIGSHQNGIVIRTNTSDWLNFDTQNSVLPDNYIHCITKDSSDFIWAGTDNGGLVRFRLDFLDLESMNPIASLEVFPNPISRQGTLYFSKDIYDLNIDLLDMQGRKYPIFLDHNGNLSSASFQDCASGTYQLILSNDRVKMVRRIIVTD